MYSGSDDMAQDPRRPTLALLVSELDRAYQSRIWSAVSEATMAADVNLLCFVGGRLGGGEDAPYEAQHNGLYDLVNANLISGLIVVSSAIGHQAAPHDLRAFISRFRPLPIVSVGLPVEGVPSVTVDLELGIRAGIRHLIVDHGLKRIAFVRGLEGQFEADARYRAYCEELAHHNIPLDMDLVAPGDFVSGRGACYLLLDTRRVAFDALVAANDTMALSAVDELRRRGLRVPHDVAILGCDDATESRLSVPPLTTVRYPTDTMGRMATEMLLDMLRGIPVTDVRLPSALVIRRSCGCIGTRALSVPVVGGVQPPFTAADERPAGMDPTPDVASTDSDWLESGRNDQQQQLWDAFSAAVEGQSGQGQEFLVYLDQVLQQANAGADFEAWHHALSQLWAGVLPRLVDRPRELVRGERLVGEARVLISEAAQRYEVSRAAYAHRLDDAVREIGLNLLAASDVGPLMDVLVTELPRIDVHGCVVALYQPGTTAAGAVSAGYTPLPEWSELALLCRDGERLLPDASDEGNDGWRFDTQGFVPNSLMPSARRYSYVVEPLTFEGAQLGFVMFEQGPQEGTVYGALRRQLSAAVQGIQVAGGLRRRACQLQAAVDVMRIPDPTMDPADFAQHVVDVLLHSLEVHFVGLYLLEDQWVLLQAGTGIVGKRMVSEGHRLRIGGSSAVGQCAAMRRSHFARAADGEAIRVTDRYLADTRSELALPLVSHGDMLGVLSLRSADPKAFRESDVATLTAVADQIAGAIENARLFKRTQKALGELEATQSRYQQQAWADHLAVAQAAEYKLGADPDGDIASSMTGDIAAAMMQKRSMVRQPTGEEGGGSSSLTVPINYSGATIGALGIHDSASRRWTDDDISLVESVVERMGLAAENLRLLDETQRRVAAEELTRSVTAEMRQTLDVEQVLQSAVRLIAEAFDAAEAHIRLTVGGAERAPKQTGEVGVDVDPAGSDPAGSDPAIAQEQES